MKNFNILAAATFAITLFANTLAANTTNINPPTEADWKAIVADAESEVRAIESIPEIRTVAQRELYMNLRPGKHTRMVIEAPFDENEIVGLVIMDADGKILESSTGKYTDLKNYQLRDYPYQNMTYVVRLYSATKIFESKLLVINAK